MRLGVRAALVDGAEVAGDVDVEDGRIAAVGLSPAGSAGLAVPGFVDLQVNGFGGVDFLTAAREDYAVAGEALAAAGVTAYQPTLISAAPDALRAALATAAAAAERSPIRVLGVHLEGPFLSPSWPGTHPPEHLRDPDPELVEELLAAAPVAAVTLAPELSGGLELVESLAARGVNVRIGHTDADASTANAAFDRGATAITHIHNAHRRFAPRDPGPAGAALARSDVTVTAIVDGVHLAAETVETVRRAAGERLCLVSDAISAAGLGDGSYNLGQVEIEVRAGRSTRADGTLAGSVGPLDASVRRLVARGAPLADAIHAAARAPALLARRPDLGTLARGAPADVVVLDDALAVTRTLVGGVERYVA
jgi:N-acetylglucosamine-6-phosphate deacetylase